MFFITDPGRYDVIVTDNLFGDIVTDIAAAVTGGIGLAASGNLDASGTNPSMFEPVHGSAPDIAGQGIADPTATVLSVGLLLDHLGRTEQAKKVNAAVAFDLSTRSPQGPVRTDRGRRPAGRPRQRLSAAQRRRLRQQQVRRPGTGSTACAAELAGRRPLRAHPAARRARPRPARPAPATPVRPPARPPACRRSAARAAGTTTAGRAWPGHARPAGRTPASGLAVRTSRRAGEQPRHDP